MCQKEIGADYRGSLELEQKIKSLKNRKNHILTSRGYSLEGFAGVALRPSTMYALSNAKKKEKKIGASLLPFVACDAKFK